MLELNRINIKNLASIEDCSMEIKDLNVIIGVNKDTIDENLKDFNFQQLKEISLSRNLLSSNGSGKSMIIEAINLCLFGTPIRPKVNTRELIRNDEEFCEIELFCKNSYLKLDSIRIYRKFFKSPNKTTIIKIFEQKENKEEVELPKSSVSFDSYILNNYINLSKEDIQDFFIVQNERYIPFLLLSDTKKKEILSKLIGLNKYENIIPNISAEIEKNQNIIIQKEKDSAKLLGKKENYQEQINNLPTKEEFKKNIEEEIKSFKDKIISIKEENKNIEDIEISKLNIFNTKFFNLLNHWTSRLNLFNSLEKNNKYLTKKEELYLDKKELEDSIKELEEGLNEANESLNSEKKCLGKLSILDEKFKTLLSNLIICPKCKHKFNPKDNKSEKDIEKEQEKNSLKISKENKVIDEIKKDIEELNKIQEDNKKTNKILDTLIKENKSKLKQIDNIKEFIQNMIKFYKNNIEETENKIKIKKNKIELNKKLIIDINSNIKNKETEGYTSIINEKNKLEEKIKDINKEIDLINKANAKNQEQIQDLKDTILAYTNLKNYIYNKVIFNIECIVNSYLEKFGNLVIKIRGNKILADGKTSRDEISCVLLRNRQETSYFTMSSGEKASVNIAFILTFQKILNSISTNGLNFLVLDEITGNVDSYNQNKILQVLDDLNKPMLFVSHVNIDSKFKSIFVLKENGISNIYQ